MEHFTTCKATTAQTVITCHLHLPHCQFSTRLSVLAALPHAQLAQAFIYAPGVKSPI